MSANRQQQRGPAWLDGYVSAEEKLRAFRGDHPSARILTQRLEGEPLTFRAEIYLESNETTIPNATGHASVDGGSGNRKQSPTEKTETAAVSRALTVMGYGGEEEEAPASQRRAAAQAPTQIVTAPGMPPVKAVVEEDESEAAHAGIDEQIMALRKHLNKTDEDLTAYARAKFKDHFLKNWDELNMAGKRWLLDFLLKKAQAA